MLGPRLALCLLCLGLLAPTGIASAEAAPDRSERLLERVNETRSNHGLGGLRAQVKLERAARRYATRLMRTDSFSHPSRLRVAGFSRVAETLAWHRGWRVRPARTVSLWMHSAPHRAILLSRSYRFVGLGCSKGRFQGSRTTICVARLGAR